MSRSFSHAESSLHRHLLRDEAQISILEDPHLRASEHHLRRDVVHHHRATAASREILILTGLEVCLGLARQDDTERARGHSHLDLALHQGDAEVDVTVLDAMEAGEGGARVTVATAVTMIEAGAEVGVVGDGDAANMLHYLIFQRWRLDECEKILVV